MASSLEELLAEEGFIGRSSVSRPRSSVSLEASSKPDSPFSNRVKTERRRSDASRYSSKGELSRRDSTTHRRPRDFLVRRDQLYAEMKNENRDRLEGGGSSDRQEEDLRGKEIIETGMEETERVEDVFANAEQHSLGRRDTRNRNDSTKYLLDRRSYSDKRGNKPKWPDASYDNINRGSQSRKSFKDGSWKKYDDSVPAVPQPALDEVAVQAIVSILSGYVKRFLKDEEFRAVLRLKCFSSVDFIGPEVYGIEDKVIVNLEQAIEMVEKAVRESVSAKELKRASLQLSVITGLNSNDGFTCKVPNAMLSSCAHIYLSVIYELQKKDRVSARHLLQVFCSSPSQARMNLLPELWDDLFFPHISHLEAWYKQEANSLSDAPSREQKLKLLEKVYNETVDSSTHQLATYYKDWLTDGIKAPSFPCIHVPSVPVRNIHQVESFSHSPDLAGPTSSFSPQPMVSKKLYDAVFGQSSKPGLEKTGDNESHYHDTCERSSDSSGIDEETLFSSIHKDFICPLTGKLFEDPVTLETGQTFERVAVKDWFDQGNRACPVTGKPLDYMSVPHTNIVLKHVIDSWKSDNDFYRRMNNDF